MQKSLIKYWRSVFQDWVGQRKTNIGWQLWWNWEVDSQAYPDWEKLVQDLRAHGIRTMTYCNPFLASVSDTYTLSCLRMMLAISHPVEEFA